jgi:hypothetical protein
VSFVVFARINSPQLAVAFGVAGLVASAALLLWARHLKRKIVSATKETQP